MKKSPTLPFQSDALWYSAGSAMFAMNATIMLLFVSRIFGVMEVGEFGIANTTAQLLYIIGIFGINAYQMTDYQEKFGFADYFIAKIVTSILMSILCFVMIGIQSGSTERNIQTLLLTFYMMINAFAELYQSLFFQKKRLDLAGKFLSFRTFLSLLSFGISIYLTKDIFKTLIIMNLVNLLSLFYLAFFADKTFSHLFSFVDWKRSKAILLECYPICVSLFIMTFMTNLSKYIIDFYGNDMMQGYYNILILPVQVINLFSSFFFKPMLNHFSLCIKEKNFTAFFKALRRQIGMVLGFTAFCCIGCFFMGIPVLNWLFNIDLTDFLLELILIIIGGGMLAISALFYYLIIIIRQQKWMLLSYLSSCTVSLLLGLILVKNIGILGAVLSFLVSYLLLVTFFSFILGLYFKRRKYE